MTLKLVIVVGEKRAARGLMIGRMRLKAEWRAALSHIGFKGWRRFVVRIYVD